MTKAKARSYYLSRKEDILDLFERHSADWRPFLARRYEDTFAEEVIQEAREILEWLIPQLPYIGGNDNPMTRHLICSSTSLALYRAMKARGKSAEETGRIVYDAVRESVRHRPPTPPPTWDDLAQKKEEIRRSREHRYPGGWLCVFVEGDGETFVYGYDFYECGVRKLYRAHGAEAFLPFFCYLDFVTYRTPGWSFWRTMTLAEGHDRCNFRFKRGGETRKGWPPPFLKKRTA
jgi:hypothetical protein